MTRREELLAELEAHGKAHIGAGGVEVTPDEKQTGWTWLAHHGRHTEIGWEPSRHQAEQGAVIALSELEQHANPVHVITRSDIAALGG